jgi:putative ABC transport system ATP-binding protein
MSDAIIRIRDLRKIYQMGKVSVEALRGVTMEVPAGEFISIVGPSGSGKSTLFHIIGGLTPPSSGEVIVAGMNVSKVGNSGRTELRRKYVSFVFQKFNLLPNLTARDNIRAALYISGQRIDAFEPQLQKVLDLLGIADRLDHRPSELSGGEQQRVAIARALATKPKILLADEPTGNLDQETGKQIVALMLEMHRDSGTTLLLITHDKSLAEQCDRLVTIRDGKIQ